MPSSLGRFGSISWCALFAAGIASSVSAQQTPFFTPGNLVVVVEGCGVQGSTTACNSVPNGTGANGSYGDNQGAPLTLFQFAPNGTTSANYVNSLVLPQTASGANLPIAGEYGSSSEGALQLSGQGQYLTLGAYGISAATFDANPTAYGAAPSNALAQSGSLTGQSYTPVARVITLIDPNGNVNSSTPVYNIFNTNNPRSVYSLDGLHAYISGQGSGTDATGGVFYVPLGGATTSPTAITGLDTTSNTIAQDTRTVQIYNGTLYVSVDSREGSGNNRSFIGMLGKPPATSLYSSGAGPTQLTTANNAATPVAVTSTGKLVLTASETNGINATGQTINLSPSNYFFANAYTMYVADTGSPKQTSASTTLGDGGLQKWVNTKTDGSGTWELMYTLSAGLNLVANSNTDGATGLYGLTGVVSGTNVYLYATNYNIADLDQTYLYGITDVLAATTNPGEAFTLLATAPADSNFKGVSFAPSYPAGSATITSVPSGLIVTTSGAGCVPGTYVTPVTLISTPGSQCQLATPSPQRSNGQPYAFSKWQDGTTSTTDTVTAPSNSATYTATFINYPLPIGNLDNVKGARTLTATVPQSDSLYIQGWAGDPTGATLTAVNVYVDGVSVGTPTTGIARPDVAAAKGSIYANSGFQLIYPASNLSIGSHTVTASATDAAGTVFFETFTINVVAAYKVPVGNFDLAADNRTATTPVHQSDLLYTQGWAADYQANGPVASVTLVIDGNAVGNATLGQSRPDVASAYSNLAWANTGWVYTISAASLSVGSHTVTAYAIDHTGLVTYFETITFSVVP